MWSDGNPMQPLSAIEAIAPAFTRVHEILFHPFRLGRSWKLAASGYLGFAASIFVPLPLFYIPLMRQPELVGLKTGLGLLFAALCLAYLAVFFFGVGLGLVNFDMIVTRGQFIGPMWRRVAGRIWPWLGVKFCVGTVISLLLSPVAFAAMHQMVRAMAMMPRATPGQPLDPAALRLFWPAMLSVYGLMIGFFFVLKAVSTGLDDFVRPFYLLEPITLVQAFQCGTRICMAEPGEVLLYLLMKLVLGVAGFIMQYISYFVVALALLIVGIVFGLLGFSIVHVMGEANAAAAKLLLIVGGGLLYLVFVVVTCWYAIGSLGYLMTLLEAYEIYFLAGRYPLLARLLEPGPGAPFTPPPALPKRDDDLGGPPFPMDPVVA